MSEEVVATAAPAAEVETAVTETPTVEVENTTETAANEESSSEPKSEPENGEPTEAKKELSEAEKIEYAMKKRINKMTKRLTEAEQALELANQRLQQFEQKTGQDQDDGKPTETQFETYEDYLKAVGKWEAMQELKAEQAKAAEAAAKAQHEEKIANLRKQFETAENEFRAKNPDYDSKVEVLTEYLSLLPKEAKQSAGFKAFQEIVLNSPVAPQLVYELGNDPDYMESLTKMSDYQVARELFYREFKAQNAPKQTPQPKQVAQPPAPIKGGATGVKPLSTDMDGKEILQRLGIYKK